MSTTAAQDKTKARLDAVQEWRLMAFEVILVLDWYSVSRYIHANPVRDGLVPDAAHWPYSSYLEWIGERRGALIDRDFVRRSFPSP